MTTVEPAKKILKTPYLDGVRGWAAFAVVVFHQSTELFVYFRDKSPLTSKWQPFLARIIMWPGNLSVTVFFVLSGRVLANSFLKTRNPERLASSAFRRTFRLLIPVMVTLYVHWFLQSLNVYEPLLIKAAKAVNSHSPNRWWNYSGDKSKIKFYEIFTRAVALLVPPYRIPPYPIFSVFWTLPIEFVNSFVLYLVAFVGSYMKNSKWTFYAVIILVNCFNNLHSWIAPFIIGFVIAEMTQLGIFMKLEATTKGLLLKILLIAIGLLFFIADYWFINSDGQSVFLVEFSHVSINDGPRLPRYDEININYLMIATCLIAYLELSPGLRWFFGSPPFAFLGKISFGMYLLHPLVIPSAGSLIASYLFNPELGLHRDIASFLTVLSILLCSSVASWIFYYIADKPSIDMGRYLESYFFSKNLSTKELRARFTNSDSEHTIYEEVQSVSSDDVEIKVADDNEKQS